MNGTAIAPAPWSVRSYRLAVIGPRLTTNADGKSESCGTTRYNQLAVWADERQAIGTGRPWRRAPIGWAVIAPRLTTTPTARATSCGTTPLPTAGVWQMNGPAIGRGSGRAPAVGRSWRCSRLQWRRAERHSVAQHRRRYGGHLADERCHSYDAIAGGAIRRVGGRRSQRRLQWRRAERHSVAQHRRRCGGHLADERCHSYDAIVGGASARGNSWTEHATSTATGKSDLLWRNSNDGAVAIWLMDGSAHTDAVAGGASADWVLLI